MTAIVISVAIVLALLLALCLHRNSGLKADKEAAASVHKKLASARSVSDAAQALILAGAEARVYLYDSPSMSLESVVTPENPQVRAFSLKGDLEGTGAALQKCVRTATAQLSPATSKHSALSYVPLVAASETLGVIEIETKDSTTRHLLESLAPAAALAFRALRSINAGGAPPAKSNREPANRAPEPLAARRHSSNKALTFLLVDANAEARAELLEQLSSRGHRVVPASADQSSDLGRSIRFDAVVWAVRSDGWKWSDYQDRLREVIPAYILVSSGYDTALADSLRASSGFLLSRPVENTELDSILRQVAGTLTAKPQ